jgi:hypothetical protein
MVKARLPVLLKNAAVVKGTKSRSVAKVIHKRSQKTLKASRSIIILDSFALILFPAKITEIINRRKKLPHHNHPGIPPPGCQVKIRLPVPKAPGQDEGHELKPERPEESTPIL